MNESAAGLLQSAHHYLATGRAGLARTTLESLVATDPGQTQAHLLLSDLSWRENRMADAVGHAILAARSASDDCVLLCGTVAALLRVGENVAARDCLQRPALAQTRDGALLVQMAGWQQVLGDHQAALALYERAHAAGVDGPEYRFHHATQLSINGRLGEAEEELEHCIDLGTPIGRAYAQLAGMRRQTPQRNHLQGLDSMLRVVKPGSEDHAGLEFARHKELGDLGRFDEAWQALTRGNAMMAAGIHYDPGRRELLLARLRKLCSPEFLARPGIAHEGPAPIFVVGMTRSGTTLLDRMLGNHSNVASAGELKDFGAQLRQAAGQCTMEMLDENIIDALPSLDYANVGRRYLEQAQWRARDRAFFVDKLPPNWQLVGPIRRALPQARILHMVRAPVDVCFSNFRMLFGKAYPWSYDLSWLAHYYRQYRLMMAHWHAAMPGRILDIHYADLVGAPEATLRNVFAFCGLDDEEGCTDLSRNQATVATMSMAQVRGGVRARTDEEWFPYATQLAKLRAAVVD